MIITAKFASTCSCCRSAIAVGSKIEWTKGAPARHVTCAGPGVSSVRAAAPRIATTSPRGRRWQPCGYPGCSPSYCDECDGEGNRGAYSFDR